MISAVRPRVATLGSCIEGDNGPTTGLASASLLRTYLPWIDRMRRISARLWSRCSRLSLEMRRHCSGLAKTSSGSSIYFVTDRCSGMRGGRGPLRRLSRRSGSFSRKFVVCGIGSGGFFAGSKGVSRAGSSCLLGLPETRRQNASIVRLSKAISAQVGFHPAEQLEQERRLSVEAKIAPLLESSLSLVATALMLLLMSQGPTAPKTFRLPGKHRMPCQRVHEPMSRPAESG